MTVFSKELYHLCIVGLLIGLSACSKQEGLDDQLADIIKLNKLNAEFTQDTVKTSDALVKLGGSLFFSPDLSIDGSVSCASCHHPDKAGADGIALPIGIGGIDSTNIGQQRIDAAVKRGQVDVNVGLIPRNSPTVFNSSLYVTALFWDGRAEYVNGANGQEIQAGIGGGRFNLEGHQQQSLLQAQARMPLTSAFEMKGGLAPGKNNHEIETDIVTFLQQQKTWCHSFREAFQSEDECQLVINLENITTALAAYQASLIFTHSPFESYIRGDKKALTEQEKRGAVAFYSAIENGGAACVNCHSGKHLSDESFYNLAIPASGVGKNNDGWDYGRSNVDKTSAKFKFRTTALLNTEHTAPYFHNGIAATLEEAILYHQRDLAARPYLKPMNNSGVKYAVVNKAINSAFNADPDMDRLLVESFDGKAVAELEAFLKALSDPCLKDEACLDKIMFPVISSERKAKELSAISQAKARKLDQESIIQPTLTWRKKISTKNKVSAPGHPYFKRRVEDVGLRHSREIGLIKKGWLVDVVNYSGVSAVDVDYDGLDDLVFEVGNGDIVFYKQLVDGQFKSQKVAFTPLKGGVNPLIVDLDGDYKMDLFVGSLGENPAYFAFDFLNKDDVVKLESLHGPVINASFSDVDLDGDLDVSFAYWRSFNSLKQPHIWLNDGVGNLINHHQMLKLRESKRSMGGGADIKRVTTSDLAKLGVADLTFTPNFVDIDRDGDQDLLLASDFLRSQVLINEEGRFVDKTDKTVIDDNNGMGAAIADFNGNGLMDWFVTSVVDSRVPLLYGHRYYQNMGQATFQKHDIVNKAAEWSWGACAKDFNNDGFEDIFYISGYGEKMQSAYFESELLKTQNEKFMQNYQLFSNSRPTLLINDGKGNFTDQSKEFGLDKPLDGRGVSCFDYQQDGDIDIVIAPLEGAPILFENISNNNNWISLRLLGVKGNTEAFGAKVTIESSAGKQYKEIRFENNYISRNPSQSHFGLGESQNKVKLTIELPQPSSRKIEILDLPINQLHVININKYL